MSNITGSIIGSIIEPTNGRYGKYEIRHKLVNTYDSINMKLGNYFENIGKQKLEKILNVEICDNKIFYDDYCSAEVDGYFLDKYGKLNICEIKTSIIEIEKISCNHEHQIMLELHTSKAERCHYYSLLINNDINGEYEYENKRYNIVKSYYREFKYDPEWIKKYESQIIQFYNIYFQYDIEKIYLFNNHTNINLTDIKNVLYNDTITLYLNLYGDKDGYYRDKYIPYNSVVSNQDDIDIYDISLFYKHSHMKNVDHTNKIIDKKIYNYISGGCFCNNNIYFLMNNSMYLKLDNDKYHVYINLNKYIHQMELKYYSCLVSFMNKCNNNISNIYFIKNNEGKYQEYTVIEKYNKYIDVVNDVKKMDKMDISKLTYNSKYMRYPWSKEKKNILNKYIPFGNMYSINDTILNYFIQNKLTNIENIDMNLLNNFKNKELVKKIVDTNKGNTNYNINSNNILKKYIGKKISFLNYKYDESKNIYCICMYECLSYGKSTQKNKFYTFLSRGKTTKELENNYNNFKKILSTKKYDLVIMYDYSPIEIDVENIFYLKKYLVDNKLCIKGCFNYDLINIYNGLSKLSLINTSIDVEEDLRFYIYEYYNTQDIYWKDCVKNKILKNIKDENMMLDELVKFVLCN